MVKEEDKINMIVDLYKRLSKNKVINAKLVISQLYDYPDRLILARQEALTKAADNVAQQAMDKILSSLQIHGAVESKHILKRWTTLNQPYNYQNNLNSLLFLVTEETVFFGYSQYYTTSPSFITKFKIVEGEQVNGGTVILE